MASEKQAERDSGEEGHRLSLQSPVKMFKDTYLNEKRLPQLRSHDFSIQKNVSELFLSQQNPNIFFLHLHRNLLTGHEINLADKISIFII